MRVQTSDGVVIQLGTLETAPTIGITDYSRRVTDDFGITTVVERGFARRMSVRLSVPFDGVDVLQRRLAALRAQPALWIADESLASLRVSGFLKDFSIDMSVPPISYCTLTIEGLTDGDQIADSGGDPAPEGTTSTLLMLQPVEVSDTILSSSSVSENDHSEWSSGTSYALAARVISRATHRIYESLVAANQGLPPEANRAQWLDVGPTNRWAMFDQALGSFTASAAPIAVTLTAGAVDAIALLDVTGSSVRVQAGSYDRTMAVSGPTVAFLDLTGISGPITVTIAPTGQTSVGTLLLGRLCALGVTEAAPSAGITDYSRKDVDDFGEVTIVERAWAKKMTAASLIQTGGVDAVMARMIGVRARPALWIGQVGLETLTIYGFFKDFSIEVGETLSKLSLSIEGLSQAGKPQPLMVDWPNIRDPLGNKPDDNATVGGTIGVDIKYGPGGRTVPPSLILNDALELTPAGQLQYYDVLGEAKSLGNLRLDQMGLRLTPAGQLQYTSFLGEIIPIGTLKLEDLGAASAAANQQIGRDLDRIAQAVQTALNEASRTRAVFTNAGFVIDPVTGVVTISAVQQTADTLSQVSLRLDAAASAINLRASTTYVDNAIARAVLDPSQVPIFDGLEIRISVAEFSINALTSSVNSKASSITVDALGARVTTAESDIDALDGQIRTKVDTTDFDRLGVRVSGAEQTLSAFGDAAAIASTISVSRELLRDTDSAAKTAIGALLSGDLADRGTVAAIATAREEMTAKINEDLSAAARALTALALRVGAREAQAVTETQARIDAIASLVRQITQLTATIGDTGAAVTSEAGARAAADGTLTAGLADSVALSRTLGKTTAAAAESALAALLAGDAAKRAGDGGIAAARDELTAKINGDNEIQVRRDTALLARIGAAEASAVVEQAVLAAGQNALSQSLIALAATVGGNSASIGQVNVALVDGDQALSDRIDTTNARVGDAEAATLHEVQARTDGQTALSGEIEQLTGRVGDAEATVARNRQAQVDGDAAIAGDLDTLNARVGDAEATAERDRQAQADGDGALALDIDRLRSRVGTAEASVERERVARTSVDGTLIAGLADNVALSHTLGDTTAAAAESALTALLAGDVAKRAGDGGIAAARDELTAKINGDNEIQVRRDTALLARIGAAEASAVIEQAVLAAGQTALSQALLKLTATVGDNIAAIGEANVAMVDADKAIADRIDTTNARIGDAEAATLREVQSRTDGQTVLAGELDQLNGRVGDAEATVTRNRQAQVDGDAAISLTIEQLSSRVGDAEAETLTQREALATATTALAGDINRLSGSVGDVSADLGVERQARIDDYGSIAATVETLGTDVGAISADLSIERQARIDGVGALSATVETVSATVDGHSGQLVQQSAVLVDLEGRTQVSFSIAATDEDGTTYIEITRQGGTGRILLGGDVITPGTITAKEIEANGITRTFSAENVAGVSLSDQMTDIVSFQVTMTRPGTIMVNAVHQLVFATGSAWEAELSVGDAILMSESGNVDHKSMLIGSFNAPAPGNYVVHLRARQTAGAVSINAGGSVMLVHRTYA